MTSEPDHLDFSAPIDVAMVDRVLRTARSVRRKLDFERAIAPGVLLDCINVANQAPTGIAAENWRFLVVTEAAPKAAIAGIYRRILVELLADRGLPMKPTHQALIDRLHEIPAMLFVCGEGRPGPALSENIAYFGSLLPAAWSLMLALRARGIGTTWTSLLSADQAGVAEVLGIPDDVTQAVMLPVAWLRGARLRPAERRDAREITYWERWGVAGGPPDAGRATD